MTPSQRNAIAVGVKTTIIGAGIIGLLGLAQENVIFRPEYEAHVSTEIRMLESVLTLQCRTTPDDTICRNYR